MKFVFIIYKYWILLKFASKCDIEVLVIVNQFLLSKIVILVLSLTVGQSAFAVRLSEASLEEKSFKWLPSWILRRPEVRLLNENSRLIISGTNISKKHKVAKDLEGWKGVQVQNFDSLNWERDIDLTPLIGDLAQTLRIGSIYPSNGPNCHGASLYLNGFLEGISFVSREEFVFYLNNFCMKVPSSSQANIGTLNEGAFVSAHSFSLISPSTIFEKKSVSRYDPFRFRLIKNFGKTEFFSCQPRGDLCPTQYQSLKQDVKELDATFSEIFRTGDNENRRKTIFKYIQPLLNKVDSALSIEKQRECRIELSRMKLRLESLRSVSDKIQGWDLYREGAGRLIHPAEPKL